MNTDTSKYKFAKRIDEARSILSKLGYSDINPVQLRRIFLLITRECFSSEDMYDMDEELRDPAVVYDESPKKRKVDVELDYLYDAEKVDEVPTVYVGIGDIKFQRKVVGDMHSVSKDNSTKYYANQSDTNLHLRHVSTSPDMSLLLANHTAGFYLAMKNLLLSNIPGMGDFRLDSISSVKLVQAEKARVFRTDVIFGMTTMFSWTTDREDHTLKDIPFSIQSSC